MKKLALVNCKDGLNHPSTLRWVPRDQHQGKTRWVRKYRMAQQGKPDELVTLQELAASDAYKISALVAVLERMGLIPSEQERFRCLIPPPLCA